MVKKYQKGVNYQGIGRNNSTCTVENICEPFMDIYDHLCSVADKKRIVHELFRGATLDSYLSDFGIVSQ